MSNNPASAVVNSTTNKVQSLPTGTNSNHKGGILLLLILCGVVVTIQGDRSGTGVNGTQYIAIAIVGFFLLLMAEVVPTLSLAFAVLFAIAILLNSPNGVPFITSNKKVA